MTSPAPLGPPEPVDPDAAESRWDGTPLDRGSAISCLAASRGRARRVPRARRGT